MLPLWLTIAIWSFWFIWTIREVMVSWVIVTRSKYAHIRLMVYLTISPFWISWFFFH